MTTLTDRQKRYPEGAQLLGQGNLTDRKRDESTTLGSTSPWKKRCGSKTQKFEVTTDIV